MSTPFYMEVVARLMGEISLLLNQYVFRGYSAVSHYVTVPLGIVAALYIVILGYGLMMGWVSMKMGNFVKVVLRIGFVYMAVTQWGWVSSDVVGVFNSVVAGLGNALVSVSPMHIPSTGGINGAMQLVLIQFTLIGSHLFNTGGFTNMGGWLDGVIVWGFGYLLIGLSLFELVLAKILIAILFVFTPLMVSFCLFKPTQVIFDRWLGSLIGYSLLQLFVTAALGLSLSIVYWWLLMHVAQNALHIGNFGTLPVIIIGLMCIGLITKAAHLAQSLGGNISSGGAAALVAGFASFAGGTMARAKASPTQAIKLGGAALGAGGVAGRAALAVAKFLYKI